MEGQVASIFTPSPNLLHVPPPMTAKLETDGSAQYHQSTWITGNFNKLTVRHKVTAMAFIDHGRQAMQKPLARRKKHANLSKVDSGTNASRHIGNAQKKPRKCEREPHTPCQPTMTKKNTSPPYTTHQHTTQQAPPGPQKHIKKLAIWAILRCFGAILHTVGLQAGTELEDPPAGGSSRISLRLWQATGRAPVPRRGPGLRPREVHPREVS